MTVNEKVISVLETFRLPVRPDFSDDDKEEYFTFDLIDDKAEVFGDDEPVGVIAYLQIHYAAPIEKDYLSLKKKVRKVMWYKKS